MICIRKIFFALSLLIILITFEINASDHLRIAILKSETASAHLYDDNKFINELTAWELFLMQNLISYKVINDDELESGIEDDFDLLILPSIDIISKTQSAQLLKFQSKGNAIINSGSKLKSNDDLTENYQMHQVLFDLGFVNELTQNNINISHSILPNNLNGYKWYNDNSNFLISNKSGILYSDRLTIRNNYYGLIESNDNSNLQSSAILYGINSNSKFLWMGFGLTDIVGGKNDRNNFTELVLKTLNWMSDKNEIYFSRLDIQGPKPGLLLIENNKTLKPGLIELLNNNEFNPILVVKPDYSASSSIPLKNYSNDIVLDLSNLQNLNNKGFTDIIQDFEQENQVKVVSIILNEEVIKNDVILFGKDEYWNIFMFSTKLSLPFIDKSGQFIIPLNRNWPEVNKANPLEVFYYSSQFDCNSNFEDKMILFLNNQKVKNVSFEGIDEFRNYANIHNEIEVKLILQSDDQLEAIVTNTSPEFMQSATVYLNLNESQFNSQIDTYLDNKITFSEIDNNFNAVKTEISGIQANSSVKLTYKFLDR